MIRHADMGAGPESIRKDRPGDPPGIDQAAHSARVRSLIRSSRIRFGGNKTLKIYGTLSCSSGKRMKVANRVFFESEAEARQAGYRPCGHCMKAAYQKWKNGLIQ